MRPKKLKKPKARKVVFSPKKVHISAESKRNPAKKPTGDRFGKKWFPHSKD